MSPWRGTVPALVAATFFTTGLGYLQKVPCRARSFDFAPTMQHACYTDIYPLYFGRGLADGRVPYFDQAKEPVEYPVLTGWFMQAVNSVVRLFVHPAGDAGAVAAGRALTFFDLTAICLVALAMVTVVATAYAAGRRSLKAGLMVALSPGLLFAAYINWDLLAVALAALAVLAWADKRPLLSGVLLGLAISAKFYPVVFLWPMLLLCVRAGQWRALRHLLLGTLGTWVVVNLPVAILAWDGWVRFYTFSQSRGVDWGSIFYYGMLKQHWTFAQNTQRLNHVAEVAFVVFALAIGVLALAAPRRPRVPQLLFLVLGAFMLTNKVWSPQYVLWLLPLVVLARPRLPAFLLWQAGEIVYYFAIWWYLLPISSQIPGAGARDTLSAVLHLHAPAHGVNDNTYFIGLFARFLTVLLLMVLVVVDILRPGRDPVRLDGSDDPAGGVLDGAKDWFRLRRPAGPVPKHAPKASSATKTDMSALTNL